MTLTARNLMGWLICQSKYSSFNNKAYANWKTYIWNTSHCSVLSMLTTDAIPKISHELRWFIVLVLGFHFLKKSKKQVVGWLWWITLSYKIWVHKFLQNWRNTNLFFFFTFQLRFKWCLYLVLCKSFIYIFFLCYTLWMLCWIDPLPLWTNNVKSHVPIISLTYLYLNDVSDYNINNNVRRLMSFMTVLFLSLYISSIVKLTES